MKLTQADFEKMVHTQVRAALAAQNAVRGGGASMIPPPADVSFEASQLRGAGGERRTGFPAVILKSDKHGLKKDEFSFVRAGLAIATGRWDAAPYERECFAATEKALTWADGSGGGLFVGEGFLPQDFIEALGAKVAVKAAGAMVVPVVAAGDIHIPKVSGSTTGYWVAQNSTITASDVTPAEVTMSPKILGALSTISRLLAFTSASVAETIIREDLAGQLARAIDLAALRGTGADSQPTGLQPRITPTGAVNTVAMGTNGAALTNFDKLIDVQYEIAVDNANGDNGAWIMHPRSRCSIEKLKDTSNRPLLTPDLTGKSKGMLLGYPVFETTQIPINLTKGSGTALSEVYFGFWERLMIGEWGALRLEATTTGGDNFKQDSLSIKAVQWTDIKCRHEESFCIIPDLAAA